LFRHRSDMGHSTLGTTDRRETTWFLNICCYCSERASSKLM